MNRQPRGVDSVGTGRRGTQDTAGFTDHCGRIGDVLEDFTGADRVHRLVGQRAACTSASTGITSWSRAWPAHRERSKPTWR